MQIKCEKILSACYVASMLNNVSTGMRGGKETIGYFLRMAMEMGEVGRVRYTVEKQTDSGGR